jgi:hypothetical protein
MYQYYHEDIIQLTNPHKYYRKIPNQHHQQTFQLEQQQAIVINLNSTPAIPFNINNEFITCHDATHSNNFIHQPISSTLCQPGNIHCQQHAPLDNIEIETIQIVSVGTHLDTSICYGKLCNNNNSSDFEIKTYTTYYLLHHLLNNLPNNFNNIITIIIDDRLLASRIQKLKQKIYPNACLLPEYEVINAIRTLICQIPQTTKKIKNQQSYIMT